ncbi:hypothetical protein E2562_030955 [Oryza meyeriana var. granulata]|uniref:Uncharacterized protein n=1 Tax=Oryza meyeriana var. granulata TaxID=110450 RepID=A0A6G1E4Q3_9ORYZ|nr:hypothetical protein E2562_030955 [Oryza meyeriana var. granulata]
MKKRKQRSWGCEYRGAPPNRWRRGEVLKGARCGGRPALKPVPTTGASKGVGMAESTTASFRSTTVKQVQRQEGEQKQLELHARDCHISCASKAPKEEVQLDSALMV